MIYRKDNSNVMTHSRLINFVRIYFVLFTTYPI